MDFSLLETTLIWATERLVELPTRHGPMYPDDIPAWLMQCGRLRLRYDDEVTEAKAGQWVLPKAGAAWHDFTDDAALISIRFRFRHLNGTDFFPRSRTLVISETADADFTQAAVELVQQVSAERLRPGNPATASPRLYLSRQACFYRWLERYATVMEKLGVHSHSVEIDGRLERAREWLHQQDFSGRFSRAQLAASAGFSVPQFTRRFSEAYGMTPRRYFEQRRFNWACGELARRQQTIKEIASELGFTSLAQFSNWFTRLAGRAPRAYRDQAHL